MFLILIDSSSVILSIAGFAIAFLGIFSYAKMAGSTNYANTGIAIGLAILGLVLLVISAIYALKGIFKSKDKKQKIIGLVELAVLIICVIVGYKIPSHSDNLNITYSNLISIFVTPLLIYIIMACTNIAFELKEKGVIVFVIFIIALLIVLVLLGSCIMGIAYISQNEKVLSWADTNFKFYNKSRIEARIEKYKTDDFNTIITTDLNNLKNAEKLYQNISDTLMFAKKNNAYFEYKLADYRADESNPSVYYCDFYDQYRNDENNNFKHYYCKIDFSTYTLIEVMDYYYKVSEQAAEYAKNGTTNIYQMLYYAVDRCKAESETVSMENINKHLKEVETNCFCEDEELEGNRIKVTMGMKKDKSDIKYETSKYYIDLGTYELTLVKVWEQQ